MISNIISGATFESPETAAYRDFLKSVLGDEVYIKSASIDSNGIADLLESLSVHPFEQVKAGKFHLSVAN